VEKAAILRETSSKSRIREFYSGYRWAVGKTDSQNLTPTGNNKPQKDLPIKSPCTDHLLLILQFTLVERVAPEPELRSIVIQTRLI
jgi:hypothetical protein